jgi:hypothetical protein
MGQEPVRIGADTQPVVLSSINHKNMLPKLSKFVEKEPSPIKKKGKTTSQPQVNHNSTSAIMVCSLYLANLPKGQKPQSYRHCGQFVINTICTCECVQRFRRRT